MTTNSLLLAGCLILVGIVAVLSFGWLKGLACVAIVLLLSPHTPRLR
jgi:hypothetical protein